MNQRVLYCREVLFALTFPVFLLAARIVVAEEAVVRGTALAHACATCHGPAGHSIGAIPSITDLPKEAFIASLRAFRSGERQGTVMNRIAAGLDEADIEAVAAYFVREQKH